MPSNKERYIAFAAETPALPLSFHPWYLDTVCEGGTWDVAIVEKQARIVAVWPYFLKKKWGISYIAMPMLAKWMGPWLTPDLDKNPVDEKLILEELVKKLPRIDFLTVDCHPDVDARPLQEKGFQHQQRITYRIPLDDPGKVMEGIQPDARRNLKRAEKVLTVSEENSLEIFCTINDKTYERQGISNPVPKAFLLRHLENLHQHQAVRLTSAVDTSGRVHSVLALTWDHRAAYYHLSGNDFSAGNAGGPRLLVRDAFIFALEKLEVDVLDFEGSMIENVARVWQSFGAEPVPYYRVQYFRNRWMRMLYRILRK